MTTGLSNPEVLVPDPIDRTIELALSNIENGGRPFACVVTRDGRLIAESPNLVVQTGDPTAHAEIVAVREASRVLGTESLAGCEIFVMAHPCPMCLGALYYADPERVVFLSSREKYADYYRDDGRYFDMSSFYSEFARPWQERQLPMEYVPRDDALAVYRRWRALNG